MNLILVDQVNNKVLASVNYVKIYQDMKPREIFRSLFYFHGKDYQNSGKNLIYAITSGGISHPAFDPLERIRQPDYGDRYSQIVLFQRFDFSAPDRAFHCFTFELEDVGLSKKLEYLN